MHPPGFFNIWLKYLARLQSCRFPPPDVTPPFPSLGSTAWVRSHCWLPSGDSRWFHEPPVAEPHDGWCGRTAGVIRLLPDDWRADDSATVTAPTSRGVEPYSLDRRRQIRDPPTDTRTRSRTVWLSILRSGSLGSGNPVCRLAAQVAIQAFGGAPAICDANKRKHTSAQFRNSLICWGLLSDLDAADIEPSEFGHLLQVRKVPRMHVAGFP